MPPTTAKPTKTIDWKLAKDVKTMESLRNAIRIPPRAAIAEDTAKAYSFVATTRTPSEAAARSLVRTARRRRPVRLRRRLATTRAASTNATRHTSA